MNSEKLFQLLHNIHEERYRVDVLKDVKLFESNLAKDLEINVEDAMAMLGYLLKKKYAKIESGKGIVVNQDNQDIQQLFKSKL